MTVARSHAQATIRRRFVQMWRRWRAWVYLQRTRRTRAQTVARRQRTAVLRRVLQSWKAAYRSHLVSYPAQLDVAQRLYERRVRRQVLARWRQALRQREREANHIRLAHAFRFRWLAQKSFLGLISHVNARKRLRATVAAAQLHLHRATLQRTFVHWRQLTHAMAAVSRRVRTALLHRVWRPWRAAARFRMRQAEQKCMRLI